MAEDGTVSWQELLTETEARFAEAGVDEASVSARRILEEASGFEGAEFTLHSHEPATKQGVAHLDAMVARRSAGEPLQYVVGRWAFRMLDLMVDQRVLIPRPETEEVAGWAIEQAQHFTSPVVVDLGTGSGAIGLSVAHEVSDSRVVLTDRSGDALDVARANLVGLGRAATRVTLAEGSWFDALPADLHGQLQVVVSNPPYVRDDDRLPAVVADWEPSIALRAGPEGLDDLVPLVSGAAEWLSPRGVLVLEMAPDQVETIGQLCLDAAFATVEIRSDLSGRPRAVIARR